MFLTPKWFQKRGRRTRIPRESDVLSVPGVLSPTEMERAYQRERARCDRNDQCFSIVVFRIDEKRDGDLRRVARLLVERVRAYDAVGAVDSNRVAALLPETHGEGSWVFADSAMAQFTSLDLRAQCKVYTYPHDEERDAPYGLSDRDDIDSHSGDSRVDSPGDPGGRRATGTHGSMTASPLPRLVEPAGATDAESEPANEAALDSDRERVVHLHVVEDEEQPGDATIRDSVIPALTDPRPISDMRSVFVEPLPLYRRAVDITVSGLAILALSPVLIGAAVLVKTTSPGSIIFWQWRAGRGGKPFRFYKFRSMYQDAESRKNDLRLVNEMDGPIFKIRDDPRITPVGRWLRKLSIDELPQLFNVLRGDMTLVGPRPPVLDEVESYKPWQRQRLDITGGLTCIWQVSGRSEVAFDDWMRMDIRYKQKRNLWMDVCLVVKTFGAVFSGRGAY